MVYCAAVEGGREGRIGEDNVQYVSLGRVRAKTAYCSRRIHEIRLSGLIRSAGLAILGSRGWAVGGVLCGVLGGVLWMVLTLWGRDT